MGIEEASLAPLQIKVLDFPRGIIRSARLCRVYASTTPSQLKRKSAAVGTHVENSFSNQVGVPGRTRLVSADSNHQESLRYHRIQHGLLFGFGLSYLQN